MEFAYKIFESRFDFRELILHDAHIERRARRLDGNYADLQRLDGFLDTLVFVELRDVAD